MKKLKILVVDDNRDGCYTMRLLLKSLGHNVISVYDGESAIQEASSFLPDIILLDIGLPDISGWEVAKLLRQREETKETKIYALSGYGDLNDVQASILAGMNYHFTKPLVLDDLWRVAKMHGVI